MTLKLRTFVAPQNRMLLVGVFIFLLSPASCSGLLMKSWSDWVSEGTQLCSTGSYSAAARAFREALIIAESAGVPNRELIEIHNGLAFSYVRAGQVTEGAYEYRNVLALIEKSEGRTSLNYALVLSGMPPLPGQGATPGEVIDILRRAVSAHRGESSESKVFQLQNNLAQILMEDGRDAEAEQVLLQLQEDIRNHASSGEILAQVLAEWGVLRFNQERYSEAAGFYLQSLQLQQSANGSEHPHTIQPLNGLATAYAKAGRLHEAHDLYLHAISICGRTLGEDQLIYGLLLQNDGYVLRKLGQKHEAKVISEKGLRTERTFLRRSGADSTVSIAVLRAAPK